jgi:hypothetical protein
VAPSGSVIDETVEEWVSIVWPFGRFEICFDASDGSLEWHFEQFAVKIERSL